VRLATPRFELQTQLYEPRWLLSLSLAALATALVCTPVWPGYMSFDSLFAYREGLMGIDTIVWPPLHAYLFHVSQALGAASWGLFLFQTFSLFLGAMLAINLLTPSRRASVFLCLGFVASFALVPAQMGVLFAQWRDVTTTSFSLLGLALWLLAARYRSNLLLAAGAAAFGAAVALRYNALPLVLPLLALMIAWPRPHARRRQVAVAAGSAVLALGLAWASTHWRLPDLRYMPSEHNLAITQAFDLIGISACADEDDMPLAMTHGVRVSGYQIRKNYDPRHLLISMAAKPGVPRLYEAPPEQIQAAWLSAVQRHPDCYLAHRLAVFVEQVGLARDDLFYPTHGTIDANPFGLSLAHPATSKAVRTYVDAHAGDLWRRPIVLDLLAVLGFVVAAARRGRVRLLDAALLGGAGAYVAALFVAGPAADARYIFPATTFCALLVVLSVGALLEPRRREPGDPDIL
jgi:hypothetical protein